MKAHSKQSELSVFESMTKAELLQSCYGRYLAKSWTKGRMFEVISNIISLEIRTKESEAISQNRAWPLSFKPPACLMEDAIKQVEQSYNPSVKFDSTQHVVVLIDGKVHGIWDRETFDNNWFEFAGKLNHKHYQATIIVNPDGSMMIQNFVSSRPFDKNDLFEIVKEWFPKKQEKSPIKSFALWHYYTYRILKKVVGWLLVQMWDSSYDVDSYYFKRFWLALVDWRSHTCSPEYYFWSQNKHFSKAASIAFNTELEKMTEYIDSVLTV